MDKGSSTVGIAVGVVIALIVGGIGGYAIGMNMDEDNEDNSSSSTTQSVSEPNPKTDTKAADVRVAMNNLLREHVSTNIATNQAITMKAPKAEIDGAKAAETANAVALADAIGGIFGDEAKKTITPMFVKHIEESNAIAAAIAAGDEGAKKAAQDELKEYLNDLSAFFSGAIKDLPKDTVYSLLEEHEGLVTRATEEFGAGKYEKSYATEAEARTQVSAIADAIASGTVKTLPEKF